MGKEDKESKKTQKKKTQNWALKIFFITFIIAIGISLVSEFLMRNVGYFIAIFILLLIISLGVFFDIIGIAVTAASDTPFVAMAAKKVKGARQCIHLVRNADQVSNFCNDVIGDICGIISGAAGAAIISKAILESDSVAELIWSIIISSIIAALTVGGKALGKSYAMKNATRIVYSVGYFLELFHNLSRKTEYSSNKWYYETKKGK